MMNTQLDQEFKSMDFGLDIERVLNARLIELNSLAREIKQKNNKLIAQRLPRFMRRRAASHNPKRVPGKFIKHPLTSTGNSLIKERRRKQRKKHVNKVKKKQSIVKRNQKENRTLLHIWFRKRFEMIEQFDHLIPFKNNTKNFRNLHNVSTKQCAFYYRPLIRLLEVRFENESIEVLMLMKSFFNTDLDRSSHQEIDLFFYQNNQCLVPISFLQPNKSTIWLSIPVDFYSTIYQTIDELFSSINMKFTICECHFERFRLIGPKAGKYLEIILNTSDRESNETKDPKPDQSIDPVNLDDLFRIESTKSFRMISECKFATLIQDKLTIILKSREKSIVDVLVPKKEAKRFWYNLVRNRGHLVGGKMDSEYYALQNGFIVYPSFGCLDLSPQKNSKKVKLIQAIIEESNGTELRGEMMSAIRSVDILNLFTLPIENYSKIVELCSKQSFVNIRLSAIKRGKFKEDDLIYMPIEQDLVELNTFMKMDKDERFMNHIVDDAPSEKVKLKKLRLTDESYSNVQEIKLMLRQSSRKVIGLIEIGNFSLSHSKSEAFGVICTNHLLELIQLIKNSPDNSKLKVLIRSPESIRFRFATIEIKNFPLF